MYSMFMKDFCHECSIFFGNYSACYEGEPVSLIVWGYLVLLSTAGAPRERCQISSFGL